jgi:hypothetical protein
MLAVFDKLKKTGELNHHIAYHMYALIHEDTLTTFIPRVKNNVITQ